MSSRSYVLIIYCNDRSYSPIIQEADLRERFLLPSSTRQCKQAADSLVIRFGKKR